MSIIAIDFGTSNTAIAILTSQDDWDIDKPKTLCFDDISRDFVTSEGIASLVPSLVYVSGKQQFLFGKQVEKKQDRKLKSGIIQSVYFKALSEILLQISDHQIARLMVNVTTWKRSLKYF